VHDAETLMAQHERRGHIQMAALQVQIGPAHAAVLDGDDHRSDLGRRYVELLHHQRPA
jgi:hypothetical protein